MRPSAHLLPPGCSIDIFVAMCSQIDINGDCSMSYHEFENHLLTAYIPQTNVWLEGAINEYTLRSEIQMERPVRPKGTQIAQLRYLSGIDSVGCCEVYDGGGRTYHCGAVKLMAAGDPKLQVHRAPTPATHKPSLHPLTQLIHPLFIYLLIFESLCHFLCAQVGISTRHAQYSQKCGFLSPCSMPPCPRPHAHTSHMPLQL